MITNKKIVAFFNPFGQRALSCSALCHRQSADAIRNTCSIFERAECRCSLDLSVLSDTHRGILRLRIAVLAVSLAQVETSKADVLRPAAELHLLCHQPAHDPDRTGLVAEMSLRICTCGLLRQFQLDAH